MLETFTQLPTDEQRAVLGMVIAALQLLLVVVVCYGRSQATRQTRKLFAEQDALRKTVSQVQNSMYDRVDNLVTQICSMRQKLGDHWALDKRNRERLQHSCDELVTQMRFLAALSAGSAAASQLTQGAAHVAGKHLQTVSRRVNAQALHEEKEQALVEKLVSPAEKQAGSADDDADADEDDGGYQLAPEEDEIEFVTGPDAIGLLSDSDLDITLQDDLTPDNYARAVARQRAIRARQAERKRS